jgi:MoaE-MoaD fusion protein
MLIEMRVRVIPFGVLKDWIEPSGSTVELPDGASVAELLERMRMGLSARSPAPSLQGIAVSVNAEYAQASRVLHDGDEVGLLPPVSGGIARADAARTGTARTANPLDQSEGEPTIVVALTREPIDAAKLVAEAKRAEDGAVVVFDGTRAAGAPFISTTRHTKKWPCGRCADSVTKRANGLRSGK